jgi:raffinose/stachyose/melibiose transport system substrate-binding protein
MMKTVGLGAAALAVPGLVAGCSSASGRTGIKFEETKPEVVPYFDNLVAKFNASQNEVTVTHDFTSNLIAEFVRGNPPAIDCDNYNLTTSIFVGRGVLADLSGLPQAKLIDPNIQALVTQYASYKGETSVLPYSVAAEGVIYNVDLFDKVGVSAVPTTWSEFLAVCEKFKSKGVTPIYQTYGDTWTTQQGLFDYTAGGMVDVAAFFKQLNDEGTKLGPSSPVSFAKDFTEPCKKMLSLAPYFNTDPIAKHYADGNLAFASSQAGMYMQGPWAVGQVLTINPKAKMGTFLVRPAERRGPGAGPGLHLVALPQRPALAAPAAGRGEHGVAARHQRPGAALRPAGRLALRDQLRPRPGPAAGRVGHPHQRPGG